MKLLLNQKEIESAIKRYIKEEDYRIVDGTFEWNTDYDNLTETITVDCEVELS